MKILLCAGPKTDSLPEKLLQDNVEFITCPFSDNLDKVYKSSGKIDKIVIFEKGIKDRVIPELENYKNDLVYILDDEDLMLDLDIRYQIRPNTYIINNKKQPLNIVFIKNCLYDIERVKHMVYKQGNLTIDEAPVQEEPEEESIEIPDIPTQRAPIKEENDSSINLDTFNNDTDSQFDIDLTEPEIPVKRKVTAENDKVIGNFKADTTTKAELITKTIHLYKEGCLIAFTGTPRSYTSTTLLSLANYLVNNELTCLIVDLDFFKCSFNNITKQVNNEVNTYIKDHNLQSAIQKGDFLSNSILIRNNLQVCTPNLLSDFLGEPEKIEKIKELIFNSRMMYDIILIDIPLQYTPLCKNILNLCHQVLFNIRMTNYDLFSLMRYIELQEDIREIAFTKSKYIKVDSKNKKLLNTPNKDLSALDAYLKINGIINEYKYENIPCIGEKLTKNPGPDYLDNIKFTNLKESENILYNMFCKKENM